MSVAGLDAPERPPRWRRPGWWILVVVLLTAIVLTTPRWGRDLAYFRVQRVEVRGTRYAPPSALAAQLAIDTTHSIWRSLDSLEHRVMAHPQVRSARISRRLPATLIVEVEEHDPIALAPAPRELRAFDATGRTLPLDPSLVPVDLPLVARPDSALLRFLGDLKAEEPSVYARVSEARMVGRDEVLLHLLDVPVRVMLDVSMERFLELSSVQADLERRRLRPVELDLRFKDQVIARLP